MGTFDSAAPRTCGTCGGSYQTGYVGGETGRGDTWSAGCASCHREICPRPSCAISVMNDYDQETRVCKACLYRHGAVPEGQRLEDSVLYTRTNREPLLARLRELSQGAPPLSPAHRSPHRKPQAVLDLDAPVPDVAKDPVLLKRKQPKGQSRVDWTWLDGQRENQQGEKPGWSLVEIAIAAMFALLLLLVVVLAMRPR